MTGPSYPVRGKAFVDNVEVAFRLPCSHGGEGDEEIRLLVPKTSISGVMEFRRFRSDDPWSRQSLERRDDHLVARIPHQPPAGKVVYRVYLSNNEGDPVSLTTERVIIRFRGGVPAFVLIPHIILIFAAMFLSTRTGLEGLFRGSKVYKLTVWTTALLLMGGMIGGPVVQKCAFGAFWNGWPFGHDLTDNKTAVAFLFWVIALWRSRRNPQSRGWTIAASVILLAVYLIPHSVLGSELDYTQMPAH